MAQRNRPPDPARVFSVITDIAITLMLIACLTAGFFIFRVAGITLDALLVNQPDGPEPLLTTDSTPNIIGGGDYENA